MRGAGRTQIAFVGDREKDKGEIFVMNIHGSGLKILPKDTELDDELEWVTP